MSYITTVSPDDAGAEVAALYEGDLESQGYIANYSRAFSLRPQIIAGWVALNTSIKQTMDLRTYELATLGAARELGSHYCSLAHGRVLATRFHTPHEVAAIATGADDAPVDGRDRAVIAYAAQVARDATAITAGDVDALRGHGLSDSEILEVTAAAAARCFFAKVLDALGVEPDAELLGLDPVLVRALAPAGRSKEPAA